MRMCAIFPLAGLVISGLFSTIIRENSGYERVDFATGHSNIRNERLNSSQSKRTFSPQFKWGHALEMTISPQDAPLSWFLPNSGIVRSKSGVKKLAEEQGAIIRGDTGKKELALVFTGDEFADGADHIRAVLAKYRIKASFFLTGNFYRNPAFRAAILALKADGHYLGAHSDKHLLYCDWNNRDSLLITQEQFFADLQANYSVMEQFGIQKSHAKYFLPPYEWYNSTIADWTQQFGLQLINFSPGTKSHTDWTYPELGKSYHSSDDILKSILKFEQSHPDGLNGFILLLHVGSDPRRLDKFYLKLEDLILELTKATYRFKRIDELLE